MSKVFIDCSIGPVQGFVAQSRRTRDLWGSSYLLSLMSAHAIRGAVQATEDALLRRPNIDHDLLYKWVCGCRKGPAPVIGSVPNHFIVEVAVGDVDRVVRAVQGSLAEIWERVCAAVWERFVGHAEPNGTGTRAIWDRQIKDYWEIVWTVGEEETSGELSRRKQWRTHRLSDEPGDKCSAMSDLQEISGYTRACSADERAKQDVFWSQLCDRLGPLDLRENERLCAVALVKRLYTKVSRRAIGWQVDTSNWPSTVHMGALPWIREVLREVPEKAAKYVDVLRELADAEIFSERRLGSYTGSVGDFSRLDANYLHRAFISEERLCPLLRGHDGRGRKELRMGLQELYTSIGSPPPIYYALLLADGDRLGDLVRDLGGQAVGAALSHFTSRVQDVVGEYGGVTIYAGGDDVLAMLPVDGALRCASELAKVYGQSFSTNLPVLPTLSVAISFAHVRLPMRAALDIARRLLDEVAKGENGRNSLAVAVVKRGGITSQWVSTWLRPDGQAVALVEALTSELQASETSERGFSSSLLHRLRDTLGLLCDWPGWRPGTWQVLPAEISVDTLRDFVHAEVLRSVAARMDNSRALCGESEDTEMSGQKLSQRISDSVFRLLFRSRTQVDESRASLAIGIDALTLARFLASGGREEDDS